MRKCSIHLCGCKSTSHPDLCFYRLPIQEDKSEQWLKLITLDRPYSSHKSIYVCSLHFPGGEKTGKNDLPTILPCSEEWPTVIGHYRSKRASLLTSAASWARWGQPETHDPTPCSSQSVDDLPSQLQGTETWQGECVDKESGSPLPTPFKRRSEKEMRCCCIVPGCIGNYPSGPEVAVFSFPRGKDMRALWVQAITQYDFTPDQYSKVCELHFPAKDIVRETSYLCKKTGNRLKGKLYRPCLRYGVVPSLMPNRTGLSSTRSFLINPIHKKKILLEGCNLNPAWASNVFSKDSRLYFKNQHTDHWLEFHHKTPVLSCMGRYNEIQKVETASNSPSNASSSSTKTSDTVPNAATSSVEEDGEDSDYEDPAVLLARGKTKQLMKLLQGYRKANSISSTSKNHQSSSKEKKFAHVSKAETVTLHDSEEDSWSPLHSQVDDEMLESLEMPSSVNDKTQITDQHPTYKKTKTRLLKQDPVTVNIEGVTFMSVFNSSQENLLSKYIKTQRPKNKKAKRKGLTREEICKLVFDFCVSRNIRRPPLWDYKQEADMEWLKGFLRRYPCLEQNSFASDDAGNGENNFEGFEVEPNKTLAPVLMPSTERDEKALQRLGLRCDHDYAVKPKQYGDLFLNDDFSFS